MDYVRSRNNNIRYWAFADSAFYVDYKSLKTGDYNFKLEMKALYETMNDLTVPMP